MSSGRPVLTEHQLGLSQGDRALLLQAQHQIAHSRSHSVAGSSSSRIVSPAGSSQGRLLLDSRSLQALSAHFDSLMYRIQQRWQWLSDQTQTATQIQYDRAGDAIQDAQAQIDRFHAILREIDELQVEFDKVRRIGEIVKGFKARVDRLERHL